MKVLMTGAAGHIGGRLRREFAGRFETLRLSDLGPIGNLGPGEESVPCDLADMAAVEKAMAGMDGVIHLGALSVEYDFDKILQANIVGTYNIYEAARRQGTKRIVFGSSNHAVGFHARSEKIDHRADIRPDSRYGLSKCWGEALSALYADKFGVETLNIRIGNAAFVPETRRALSLWISGRDLAQLIAIGLEHPEIRCEIVYGISNNARAWYDNSNAFRLGYKPQDSSDEHVAAAEEGEKKAKQDEVSLLYQGGPFCSAEYAKPLRPARPR
jgi:uronate dehydrogenase